MDAQGASFDVQPTAGNHFSWMNTALSLQRTLMSAVRTSVSLIGFGFTVAQFFERMQGKVPEGMRPVSPEAPRNLGLMLIGAGVLLLGAFTWQYHKASAYMHRGEFQAIALRRDIRQPVYLAAIVVMLIGVAAFLSVAFHF